MKGKLGGSFRIEIVIYSLLSLVLTLITEALLFGIIYFVVKLINPTNISYDMDLGGNVTNRVFDEYRFRENVNISIRLNRELFIATIILAILIGIALFIIYFLLLTRKFTRQLHDIVYGIKEIASGNLKHRIPINSVNEFGTISLRLNKMAYQLEQILEENEKNEKNKNAMVTSLAHDLRTPLTSINGYLDLITNNQSISEETKEHYLEVVYNKSKNLEALIDDLFDYTRVSLGEISIHKTTINMVQFINQLVDEFYPSFREYDLEYSIKIEESPIYIEGDGELLARAISNLIANAIKYGKDGKMVNVFLTKVYDKVILQIFNYGKLIPEESLPHLFERFYRVEGSRSSETGGTGLGLSIAKEIIELHSGSISVRSDYKGTVFEVILMEKGGEENEEKT